MRPFDSLTLMQFLWAALSIFGFAIRTNLKGFSILLTALGGGLSWAFYLISLYYTKSPLLSVLISTILVCSYSELVAPRFKTPVSVFVICAIIPLVPGSGLYYTMRAYLDQNMTEASSRMLQTLMIAGTISIGIAIVSSVTNLIHRVMNKL
ncbi:MAG: hypothetical protein CVU49_05960 [Candidatus Cloacimonetes bacterium HGW-Cloacimonetes-2]|jgi:uncharacterized membrane protein YjjB (DUF3815 family)|nr:MAG: hypothetical protein CVU49_05960 [Candidatus Cloacimonetes bacterium HGW-Cloacimonetes-2]